MHKLLSALHEWRARPSAVLPLAFLQALAVGLDGLPSTYIFRAVRCEEYRATAPPHLPEDDLCRAPAVQKAYSTDIAVFTTLLAVLSIVLSGPYGRLSDVRGRKRALGLAVALNMLGDAWFALCAVTPVLRKPWPLQLAAVLQGFGGGFSVVLAGQNAFLADTTAPRERSYYMGLALVMWWAGNAVGPLFSGLLLDQGLYAANFAGSVLVWAVYLSYLALVVREVREPAAEDTASEDVVANGPALQTSLVQRLLSVARAVLEPMIVLVQHTPLLLLSIAMAGTVLAVGVFNFIIPYCDTKFGLGPSEAAIISASWSVSRAISVIFLLPIFLTAYQCITRSKEPQPQSATTSAPEEATPLLSDNPQEVRQGPPEAEATSISQELTIVRFGLVLDAVGMVAIERSRNAGEIILATIISSFGAPAGPSLQALLTLAAPPGEVGRVLAGLSVLQSAAIGLRGPLYAPILNATLDKAPGAIWWISATGHADAVHAGCVLPADEAIRACAREMI